MTDTLASQVAREVTNDEVERYRENGWVLLKGLVEPDLVRDLLGTARAIFGQDGSRHESRPGLDPRHEWWTDYHFPSEEGIEPFRTLNYSGAMGKNAQRLMGRDIAVKHFHDAIVCRAPAATGRHSHTPYHQDYPCGPFDRGGYVQFWIALDEVPPERGSMRFYSGSQKLGSLGQRLDTEILEIYPDIEERFPLSDPVHLNPGDATAHGMYTIHGAPANATPEPRWSCISAFIPADTLYTGLQFIGMEARGIKLDDFGPFEQAPHFPVVYPR